MGVWEWEVVVGTAVGGCVGGCGGVGCGGGCGWVDEGEEWGVGGDGAEEE